METRARYVVIGLFATVVLLAGFAFVWWINNAGGLGGRTAYRVRFETPVSGLLLGSSVSFNGIRVGEVTELHLDPADPRAVIAAIAIENNTPLRTDTQVGLGFGGLTGNASITLTGGTPGAAPPASTDGGPPLLNADNAAARDWTGAARDAFSRVDTVLTENASSLKSAVASIDTFASALARNSGKVDGIVSGLEKMTGVGAPTVFTTYNLDAPTAFPADLAKPGIQLTVQQPTVLVGLDTQRFVMRDGNATSLAFDEAKWADSVPLLVRSQTVRAFENAGYTKVSGDQQDLSSDHKLLIDIRAFDVTAAPNPVAEIELTAKIADGDTIGEVRMFKATAPVATLDAASTAKALNEAFGKTLTDLVTWAMPVLAALPADAPDKGLSLDPSDSTAAPAAPAAPPADAPASPAPPP